MLPANAPLGQSFAVYAVLDDVILELKVTPNRADVLSHRGLAREIAVLFSRELRVKPSPKPAVLKGTSAVRVRVAETELCPRYLGVHLKGVKSVASPLWLRRRLEAVGQKPLNALVDVTNYVMFELGQPLHAFDRSQIQGSEISVRRARAGELLTTFDSSELRLQSQDLVICDAEGPLALAGIIGGLNSGVSDSTEEIFLEAAFFQAAGLRRTSRALGISTESGHRFTRGVDPEGTEEALLRAVELYQEMFGAEASKIERDEASKPIPQRVRLRLETLQRRLNPRLQLNEVAQIFRQLRFDFEILGEEFHLSCPSFRVDLNEEIDFVEEVARIKSYAWIPEKLPESSQEPRVNDRVFDFQLRWIRQLLGLGYSQCVHSALSSEALEKKWGGGRAQLQAVRVLNPLSEDTQILRKSLSARLVENVERHLSRGVGEGRLFEMGSVFEQISPGVREERLFLAVAVWEPETSESLWPERAPLVLRVKGDLMALDPGLIPEAWDESREDFLLHPGRRLRWKMGANFCGWLGELHPQWGDQGKLRSRVVVAELDLHERASLVPKLKILNVPSRFPKVVRDLAFVMPRGAPVGPLLQFIEALDSRIEKISVLSIYEGEQLSEGKKSLALTLDLRKLDGTWTDAEVHVLMHKIQASVQDDLGFPLR
ncbi:MAG: phenylalanine--tRNA ligase subunit beta [Bdellovibrio sp.]